MSSLRTLLSRRYFPRYVAARFISNFGNGMGTIALTFAILHLKGGSASEVGVVLGSSMIAFLVMSPLGGVIADRYGRIRVAALTDITGGAALLLQAYYFSTGHVPLQLMLVVNILFGITWALFWPALTGVIPSIIKEEELQRGNSIVQFASNLAIISGTAIGGVIISSLGSTTALVIDALSFIINGLMIATFRHLTPRPTGEAQSVFDDLIHGWRVFLSFRWIVVIVGAFSFIVMCWAGAENVLGPLIAEKKFHGASSWAIVLSCESVGFLVGSLIAMKYHPKYPMRFLVFTTFSVVLYIGSLVGPLSIAAISFCAFLWGISLDLWGAIWGSALQRMVPKEALSRVSAFDGMGSLLFRPLGLMLAAPLSEWVGVPVALKIFAGIAFLLTLLPLFVRDVWMMQLSENS